MSSPHDWQVQVMSTNALMRWLSVQVFALCLFLWVLFRIPALTPLQDLPFSFPFLFPVLCPLFCISSPVTLQRPHFQPCLLFHRLLLQQDDFMPLISPTSNPFSTQPLEWYFCHKGLVESFSSSKFSSGSCLLPERIKSPYMAYQTLSDHNRVPSIIPAICSSKTPDYTCSPLSLLCFALSTYLLMPSTCLSFKHHSLPWDIELTPFLSPLLPPPKVQASVSAPMTPSVPSVVKQEVTLSLFAHLVLQ